MKLRLPWKQSTEGLDQLEEMLAAVLQPVLPRAQFTADLQEFLTSGKEPPPEWLTPPALIDRRLLAFGAILSAAVVLVSSVRVLIAILGVLGMYGHLKPRLQGVEEGVPLSTTAH